MTAASTTAARCSPARTSRPARNSRATRTSTATASRTARYPAPHETKGAYFTRGTSRNPQAIYSEAGPDYVYNMQRLQQKFEFAKTLVQKPVLTPAKVPARFGCIYYGSTSPSMHEALESLSGRTST